jgi:hypothetical protein
MHGHCSSRTLTETGIALCQLANAVSTAELARQPEASKAPLKDAKGGIALRTMSALIEIPVLNQIKFNAKAASGLSAVQC